MKVSGLSLDERIETLLKDYEIETLLQPEPREEPWEKCMAFVSLVTGIYKKRKTPQKTGVSIVFP